MTTIGVVALQGAVGEHVRMLAGLGAVVREVRTPSALDGLDGLVLPGGESTAMARAGATTGLFEEVRARRESGLPLFGTCAGLVLLADRVQGGQALGDHTTVGGLDLTARRNAFGGQLASSTAPLQVSAFPGRAFPGIFIRAPQVVQVGAAVDVLARSGTAGDPVAVRQGQLLATSFHPELSGDDRFHRLFLQICGAAS